MRNMLPPRFEIRVSFWNGYKYDGDTILLKRRIYTWLRKK
jgi:hypothetical protein